MTIEQRIGQHRRAIAAMAARIDAISADAESEIRAARAALGDYRAAKRHAAELLGVVSRHYGDAEQIFVAMRSLAPGMRAIAIEHANLSREVNRLLSAGAEGSPGLCSQLAAARENLREVCARLEQADPRTDDDVDDPEPDTTDPPG